MFHNTHLPVKNQHVTHSSAEITVVQSDVEVQSNLNSASLA